MITHSSTPSTVSLPFMCIDIGVGFMLWNKEKQYPFLVETGLIDFDASNVPNNPDEGLIIHAEGYLHSDGDGMKAVKVWVDDPPVIEVLE